MSTHTHTHTHTHTNPFTLDFHDLLGLYKQNKHSKTFQSVGFSLLFFSGARVGGVVKLLGGGRGGGEEESVGHGGEDYEIPFLPWPL